MDVRLMVAAIVVLAGSLPGTLQPRATLRPMQEVAAEMATSCTTLEGGIATKEQPTFLAAVPEVVMVTALAHHVFRELPEGNEFIIVVDQLSLQAGTETKSRRTVGPTLFLVEQGTMAVFDSGRAVHAQGRSGLEPGESARVERNRLVQLENASSEPAGVLVVGLLPPVGELPIGAFGAPAAIWIPISDEGEQHSYRQVVSGSIGALAHEETLVFAACLRWHDAAAELAAIRYPGPVGLLVVRGQAVVNGTHRVAAGDCWLSPSYTPLQVGAGQEMTDILLFGAWNASVQPQRSEEAIGETSSLDCVGLIAGEGAEE